MNWSAYAKRYLQRPLTTKRSTKPSSHDPEPVPLAAEVKNSVRIKKDGNGYHKLSGIHCKVDIKNLRVRQAIEERDAVEACTAALVYNPMVESNGTTSKVTEDSAKNLPDSSSENGSANTSGEDGETSEVMMSDNPNETCLFICAICRQSVGILRKHIRKHHKLDVKRYHDQYPALYQRKTNHRYRYSVSFLIIEYSVSGLDPHLFGSPGSGFRSTGGMRIRMQTHKFVLSANCIQRFNDKGMRVTFLKLQGCGSGFVSIIFIKILSRSEL
jgi:hypothetical protein